MIGLSLHGPLFQKGFGWIDTMLGSNTNLATVRLLFQSRCQDLDFDFLCVLWSFVQLVQIYMYVPNLVEATVSRTLHVVQATFGCDWRTESATGGCQRSLQTWLNQMPQCRL